MASADFFTFLSRGLDALGAEVPLAYSLLSRNLGGRTVRITVDGDTRCLRVHGGRHSLDADGIGDVELRTDRGALVSLVEARESLLSAIMTDRLMLRGAPNDLVALYDALTVFIQGAVRSSALPALLDAYLNGTQSAQRRRTAEMRSLRTSEEG